jgi:hypothetical protein
VLVVEFVVVAVCLLFWSYPVASVSWPCGLVWMCWWSDPRRVGGRILPLTVSSFGVVAVQGWFGWFRGGRDGPQWFGAGGLVWLSEMLCPGCALVGCCVLVADTQCRVVYSGGIVAWGLGSECRWVSVSWVVAVRWLGSVAGLFLVVGCWAVAALLGCSLWSCCFWWG